MRMLTFAKRCAKEILRDPINLGFGLGFPLVLLLLLSALQANIPVDLFEIHALTPGITVFGLSFMTLFSATLVAKDRESAFLQRLYTTPLGAFDFIIGYMLPLLPIALGQTVICYLFAIPLGLTPGWDILYAVVGVIMAYILGSYYIGKGGEDTATTGQVLGMMALLIISSCSFFLTVIVMISNFQRSLYGEQGYLTFTLPVKSTALLASKVIVSTIWFIAAFVCLMGTMAIMYFVIKEDYIGQESYAMIESMLPMLLGGKSLATVIAATVISLISFFIRFAVLSIEVYFAISLANTRHFQKKHLLWTIVFSMGIIYIAESISTLISDNIDFGLAVTADKITLITNTLQVGASATYVNLMTIIISLLFGAGFFYATHYVMNKKVNIG